VSNQSMQAEAGDRVMVELTPEEKATILAALRIYEVAGYGNPSRRSGWLHEIATDGGRLVSLDSEEINKLYDRLSNL
jgi:hypothetical protein